MSKIMDRRSFLRTASLAGAGIVAASCAPAATPAPQAATDAPSGTVAKKFKKSQLIIPSWWAPHEIAGAEASFNGAFKDKTGISVKYEFITGGDFNAKIFTNLSSGNPYDVITYNADSVPAYKDKGVLQTLDNFIARDKFDLDNIVPSALEQWTYDGKVYGLTADMGSFHTYINLDLFEKAGITPPKPTDDWTWDQLLDYAKKLTIKTGDQITQYGFSGADAQWCFDLWPNMNGTFVFDKEMKTSMFDDPKVIEAYQFYQDLIYKEGVALKPGSVKTSSADLFLAGQLAMFIDGTWQVGYLRSKKAEMKYKWDVAMLPKGRSADKLIVPNFTAGWVMPKNAQDPDASWEAMKWYVSDQFAKDCMFKVLSGLPTTKSALAAAEFAQWPSNPPQGLTKEFYGKMIELGAARRHLRFDLGSDINAALQNTGLIFSNEKSAKEVLTQMASDINTGMTARPWNK
ncbi:MAG: Lactose-binding protein [Nitrosomonadaceae bacterium]|nr:Lactose-binding protein [Nitrosomonadaceae bacterium]